MRTGTTSYAKRGVLVAAAIVAVVVAGSLVYWLADGRPGTPADFRQRVSETGLNVAWSTSGPRGGAGLVETDCGPVDVAVDEIDEELWIRWAENRERITPETVAAVLSCSPQVFGLGTEQSLELTRVP